jgi:hypothetical protein
MQKEMIYDLPNNWRSFHLKENFLVGLSAAFQFDGH